ncbi:MAG TPA: hemerythrin domain-containing protein [Coleofasciculaceae cyanobacterium]|jgi:hemerythrin superfamily protein
MSITLDDTKRLAIGEALADMKAMQNLIISYDQKLIEGITDEEIRKRLRDFMADDQKNLGVLDTVIVQYGVQAEPRQTTHKIIEQAQQMLDDSELSIFEKTAQFELLKHAQVGKGLVVHKCAQVVGADVMAAISPLNAVNFDNRAHQEQLKAVLEVLGTRELTGKEPDQSFWGRIQDAVAALSGVAGSVVTRSDDEMTIREIIRMDHAKTNTIFTEIGASNDPQKIAEYYGQLYKDLNAHAIAEEQVVYPKVRAFYDDTRELYDEQAEMKQMLDQIKSMNPASNIDEFKSRVKQLMDIVGDHIRQEESTMFTAIGNNLNHDQEKQMATEFKTAKSQVQQELAASK